MTKLERGKKVRREIPGTKYGELVVTMTDAGLLLREKGRRTTYGPLDWSWLYLQGAKLLADQVRRERAAKRKARRAR